MDSGYNTPAQVIDYVVETGYKKSILPTTKMLLLGIMAGVFLSLAGSLQKRGPSFIRSDVVFYKVCRINVFVPCSFFKLF